MISDRTMAWVAYPGTMILMLALHGWLLGMDSPALASGYAAVIAGAVIVTLLEWFYPNEKKWRPPSGEVAQDILYMVVVQMVLPKLLTLWAVLAITQTIGPDRAPLAGYWPHQFPVWVQVALMVLVADFFRYWLHRAAHKYMWLWRLHAVHHSPHRLYWVNVGRFHILEKALQFLLDALPFILLGVVPEVITAYFVFYALNGFFQHSNIKLRYGILNYIISGAELHRWHHSYLPVESNNNYGNNVIVFDLLFGSWFLPRERKVGELGLTNRSYPMQFVDQLSTPFIAEITDRERTVPNWRNPFRRLAVWLRMQWVRIAWWRPMAAAARKPRRAQARALGRILRQASQTRFGREHGLSAGMSYEAFAHSLPPQDYESLRPYIEAQEEGEVSALTQERPFMYAVTSGTTGKPKFLPVLKESVRQYQEGQRIFTYMAYSLCPAAFTGKIFAVVSPAVEGHRPGGLPFGSMSGHLYEIMPRFISNQYVIPPVVNGIKDYRLKYKVMLLLALAEPEVTIFAGANPSSFLQILKILNECREELADSLETGTADQLGTLPSEVLEAVLSRLKPNPERAQRLREANGGAELSFGGLWPRLGLMMVWTGGSCGVALEALRRCIPPNTNIADLGMLASEARLTVTVDPATGEGLPMLHHHFFEFVERNNWDAGARKMLLLDELEEGADYYILITTSSGLYRYFMNDIVRVGGRFGNTPTIRFLQKGRGVTSITGEKLYENQVLKAVEDAADAHGFVPLFVMALADEKSALYRIYIEPGETAVQDAGEVGRKIEHYLSALNVEYASKRASERLAPLQLHWLQTDTAEAYRSHCIAKGMREGQFKTIALQKKSGFIFPIEKYVTDER